MVKVKICGITNKEDAFWASSLGADFVGLNFCKDSLRKVSVKTAKEITESLPKYTSVVGVFVNETLSEIVKTVKKVNLEYVQLHGEESKEICAELKSVLPRIKIIKVIKIAPQDLSLSQQPETKEIQQSVNTIVEQITSFLPHIDYILFDTKIDGQIGGTGETFNWDTVLKIKNHFETQNFKLQFFVAGGLNTENVSSVIELLYPFAVDVSSGVERLPRRKDFEKMKLFIRKAKGG
jgi:phosphoribosylanthranilate isomerase